MAHFVIELIDSSLIQSQPSIPGLPPSWRLVVLVVFVLSIGFVFHGWFNSIPITNHPTHPNKHKLHQHQQWRILPPPWLRHRFLPPLLPQQQHPSQNQFQQLSATYNPNCIDKQNKLGFIFFFIVININYCRPTFVFTRGLFSYSPSKSWVWWCPRSRLSFNWYHQF